MKKLYIIAVIAGLLCLGTIQQQHIAVIAKKGDPVDYTGDANCMGFWYMNNNGGNETDRSGEGGTLTQTGGTIPTDTGDPWAGGGVSRDFTASETEWLYEADGGSTDISGADQHLSICVWIKLNGNADDMVPVGKWVEAGDERSYLIKYDGNGTDQIEFRLSDDGDSGITTAKSTASISDTNWHHICAVYDDVEIVVYLDKIAGTPVAHTTGVNGSSAEFRVGQYEGTNYFDGLIDEVGIFDRSLSAGEVVNIYTFGGDGASGEND